MAGRRIALTAEIEQSILAYIRAGGYPHVAAEAAGVPRQVFERWLRLAGRYRTFAAAVRQAQAQARLGAEITIFSDRPVDWLRYGPGKETDDRGWTGTVKPQPIVIQERSILCDPEMQRSLATLLEGLAGFPEARAAVAPIVDALSDNEK